MGIIVDAIYSSFPGLADLEKKTEEAVDYFSRAFRVGKGIGDYVLNNTDRIINTLEKSITSYVSGLINIFKQDFLGSYGRTETEGEKPFYGKPEYNKEKTEKKEEASQREEAEPVIKAKPVVPVMPMVDEKKNTLDDLVNDFKHRIKQFNPVYDVSIDVYDKGSVIKSYAVNYNNQAEEKPAEKVVKDVLENKIVADDNPGDKYFKDSIRIAEMYNQGYKTRWIVKEAAKKGYAGINNYNDITDRVALSISSGMNYTNSKYNNSVATKLGVREQLVNDYLSGKSYKEIKENLKAKTNGMSVSDSSILRIMHQYEAKTGRKVIGKRNGKANCKENGKRNSKGKSK